MTRPVATGPVARGERIPLVSRVAILAAALAGAGATLAQTPAARPASGSIGAQIEAAQAAQAQDSARRRAERAEKEAAWARAALDRKEFAVRGVRLGMTMAELEAALRADTVEIRPERKDGWKLPEFGPYTQTLRLADGSSVSATFSSPVTGSLAGAIGYEQTLRDGPTLERLVASLVERYGVADETHAQGTWLTWHLRSRVSSRNDLGAMLRAVVNLDASRQVTRYTLTLSDYTFLRDDESRAFEARRAAAARERDARKSDGVKF